MSRKATIEKVCGEIRAETTRIDDLADEIQSNQKTRAEELRLLAERLRETANYLTSEASWENWKVVGQVLEKGAMPTLTAVLALYAALGFYADDQLAQNVNRLTETVAAAQTVCLAPQAQGTAHGGATATGTARSISHGLRLEDDLKPEDSVERTEGHDPPAPETAPG